MVANAVSAGAPPSAVAVVSVSLVVPSLKGSLGDSLGVEDGVIEGWTVFWLADELVDCTREAVLLCSCAAL